MQSRQELHVANAYSTITTIIKTYYHGSFSIYVSVTMKSLHSTEHKLRLINLLIISLFSFNICTYMLTFLLVKFLNVQPTLALALIALVKTLYHYEALELVIEVSLCG